MHKESFTIRAANVSKQYRLGQAASLDDGIRETLNNGLLGLRQSFRRSTAKPSASQQQGRELIWALRDVSFEIEPGTAVGLIGRNGAGKSTLLKILSRITPPTSGEAWIKGRIASLLEIGTGFQQDLTGRENVFLNGAILGMRRREVHAHFDEIVEFAQLERFIDTPVKRYSSGMFMRLAFSVAAHLDAEILLMDEVLAVGDLGFQRRCLEKVSQVTGNGRTVIFVSHKLGAVRRLCQRVLYLDGGRLIADGPTEDVLSRYVRDTLDLTHHDEQDDTGARFLQWQLAERSAKDTTLDIGRDISNCVTVGSATGSEIDHHSCIAGDDITFKVKLTVSDAIDPAWFQIALWGEDDEVVLSATSRDGGRASMNLQAGTHDLSISMRVPLRDGHYAIELALCDVHGQDVERVELPPRLIVLPREDRVLPRERRGVIDESADFHCQATPSR